MTVECVPPLASASVRSPVPAQRSSTREPRCQLGRRDGGPAPAAIDTKAGDAVERVIAGSDAREDALHAVGRGFAGGGLLPRPLMFGHQTSEVSLTGRGAGRRSLNRLARFSLSHNRIDVADVMHAHVGGPVELGLLADRGLVEVVDVVLRRASSCHAGRVAIHDAVHGVHRLTGLHDALVRPCRDLGLDDAEPALELVELQCPPHRSCPPSRPWSAMRSRSS